ncbi:MAG: acyl-CoA thioester hydrolase/BAAT C-terminal domain-containing protein [Pseudomonadota bacterium]
MTEAHENGRAAFLDRSARARIAVEKIDEPVLLIGGDQDTTWASGNMARTIAAQREAAGLPTELYVYENASHAVGGTPIARVRAADLEARLENFPATIEFLKRNAERKSCGATPQSAE